MIEKRRGVVEQVGVLSTIRFRTDLKASRDLVFVMGTAALGVSSGVEAWMVGILGTLVFSGIALYLATGLFGSKKRSGRSDSFAQLRSQDLCGLVDHFFQDFSCGTSLGQHSRSLARSIHQEFLTSRFPNRVR